MLGDYKLFFTKIKMTIKSLAYMLCYSEISKPEVTSKVVTE